MSADYGTKHFKGFQHDGYIHVVRKEEFGDYPLGNLTKEDMSELNEIFNQAEEVD
jgi:hypothetical protein